MIDYFLALVASMAVFFLAGLILPKKKIIIEKDKIELTEDDKLNAMIREANNYIRRCARRSGDSKRNGFKKNRRYRKTDRKNIRIRQGQTAADGRRQAVYQLLPADFGQTDDHVCPIGKAENRGIQHRRDDGQNRGNVG
jgi:hypothetical protein